jgi:hypothetical protein
MRARALSTSISHVHVHAASASVVTVHWQLIRIRCCFALSTGFQLVLTSTQDRNHSETAGVRGSLCAAVKSGADGAESAGGREFEALPRRSKQNGSSVRINLIRSLQFDESSVSIQLLVVPANLAARSASIVTSIFTARTKSA